MSVIDQYLDLIVTMRHKPGEKVVNLGEEFLFNLRYPNLKSFYDDYLDQARWLSFHELADSYPMPEVTSKERRKIYDIESYEREMILNDLKFSTHIMMSKYNEPVNSRRFVATNDSCLSFAQVTVDPSFYRWIFVSRSTEVNRMLPADLHTIGTIIEKWTSWFITYNPAHFDPSRGVMVTIMLNNPHYYKK